MKHGILTLLPWILSVLPSSATLSYTGASGSDAMSTIRAFHFVPTFLQVNNLWKGAVRLKYSIHLLECLQCQI